MNGDTASYDLIPMQALSKGKQLGGNMKLPDLLRPEEGSVYSDWVLGIYHKNTICPYRIVRLEFRNEVLSWEYADNLGENEDTCSIEAPDQWQPIEEVRGK